MSAKDQIKQIVDYFKREPQLKDKTDGMAEGLLLGANLADEANERSKDAAETTLAVQEKYKEQILTQDLNPNKDPELVDIRDGSLTAGERIRKFEQETNRQLAQTEDKVFSVNDFLGVGKIQAGLLDVPLASNEWRTDQSGIVLNMSTDQFYDLFYNPYVGSQSDGYEVKKNILGYDQSGLYPIYEYDFIPKNYTKTILLSSGMHTYELSAHFGLGHFIKHLMTEPYIHEGFKYLKQNVRIKVVPIINPWGWNQSPKKYGNSNGVNINRNFDSKARWSTFPVHSANPNDPNYDEWNVKGDSPFSESETRILRDWATSNKNAEFWVDMHTGLWIDPVENFIYYFSSDPLANKIENTLNLLEERIKTKYKKNNPTKIVNVDNNGLLRGFWALEQIGLSTMTIEQTPNNPLWGTNLNNESGDITEYEITISAYVFGMLGVDVLQPVPGHNGYVQQNNKTIQSLQEVIGELEYKLYTNKEALIQDSFNRPDSSNLGNTPIGNKTWINDVGTFQINGNKLKEGTQDSTGNRSHIDTGISNYVVTTDITWDSYAGVHFRYKNATSNLIARINSTGIRLVKYEGDDNNFASLGDYAFTPTKGRTYNVTVIADRQNIMVYLDGKKVIQAIESEYVNETKVGLRTFVDANSRFDNFSVKSIN